MADDKPTRDPLARLRQLAAEAQERAAGLQGADSEQRNGRANIKPGELIGQIAARQAAKIGKGKVPEAPEPAPVRKEQAPPKTPVLKSKEITPRIERLIDIGIEIAQKQPSGAAVGYMHAVLSQVGLPRSKFDGRIFERASGGASLVIEAGRLWNGREWVEQPIPYGPKPRVMMADLFNYAIKHQTRTIDLGESVTNYLHRLGWTSQGGEQGPLTLFKKQAQALAACRMTLGMNYGGRAHTVSGQPIKRFEAWFEDRDEQRPLWPATLELSTDFFESLREFAVPLDMRAVRALSGSALALDLYTALAHRLHRMKSPIVLQWASWRDQFGQEYSDPKDFRRDLLKQTKAVLAVYPAAKVQPVKGGLELHPSPPPVPKLKVARGGG